VEKSTKARIKAKARTKTLGKGNETNLDVQAQKKVRKKTIAASGVLE
jgi:hypothetical protein